MAPGLADGGRMPIATQNTVGAHRLPGIGIQSCPDARQQSTHVRWPFRWW